ncbi:hypothetical protein [Actinoplanes sp. DH11]|uniref:hypothetical protein n=1 Tax=Actinoplanes sp. DH11 TaxID=2857011 RepID=UPI001E2EAAA1|nr:hypothetical protein [Actinoplanes sp. DH11]
MSSSLWLVLAGGVLGAGAAVYGMITLARTRRRRAGLYGLCFGLAVVLLSLASWLNSHDAAFPAVLALVAAICLGGVAVVRYRPRDHAS